jgi:hypothetical protein
LDAAVSLSVFLSHHGLHPLCRRLDLSANPFYAMPHTSLASASALTYLNLSKCRLPPQAVAQLKALAGNGFLPCLRVLVLERQASATGAGETLAAIGRDVRAGALLQAAERGAAAVGAAAAYTAAVLRLLTGSHI